MNIFLHTKEKEHGEQGERGVAILFAILITSVLLIVAIGIANVSYKELLFSNEARDSDRALYAADTGIECALYLDKQGAFDGTSGTSSTLECAGATPSISGSSPSFSFSLPNLGNGSCSDVYVNKAFSTTETEIRAYGFNVPGGAGAGCLSTATLGPRLVTRALRVHFPNP